MAKIADFLSPESVIFLDAGDRDLAIKKMIQIVHQNGKIPDAEAYYSAILEREKIVSTGIGMGVAIPHAKLSSLADFFIAIGILKTGVDWKAFDGAPVRLIFMIGGPEGKQTAYLQLLSSLTLTLKDEEKRKKILTMNSPEAIIKLFSA